MGKIIVTIVAIAAVVAIAVFAPEIAAAIFGVTAAGTATAAAIAITTAVLSIAASIAISLVAKALGVGSVAGVPQAENTGPPQVFRQSITDSFIIYGKRRVGGLLVFFHAKVVGSDHFRYFAIAVAGHRCQGVASWMLNDDVVTVDGSGMVTSGPYANAAWLWFQRGLASETANATFVSECGGNWTANHKGNGTAAIYAKFQLTDAVIQAGMPNITAVVEGRDEITDYRNGSVGYTRNAALIFYDWMMMPREDGGFGAYDDELPPASWISAQANVCDEVVSANPRYALDCYLTTGSAPGEVRDALIVNVGGSYTYSGGKHLMRPGYWVPVTANLEEKDLSGPIQVSPFMTSDASANQIQGTYISPADGYQGMPFTTWTRPDATDLRQLNLDLAFTTNRDQADRIAAIMGKRAACEKTVVWPMNIMGIKLRALDTVQLDSARYGLNNYAWVVSTWGLGFDPVGGPSVVVSLREENAEIYDDPVPVSPSSPPTIVQPSGPLLTNADLQTALRGTYPQGLGGLVTGIDAGTDASIHFSGSFTLRYPGQNVTIAAPANITGLAYSTSYYPYCDVTGPGDASPTFGATTVYADALNSATHPGRIYLNIVVTTPAHGGGATSGDGGSGGYGGGCVTVDTPVLLCDGSEKPAGELKIGDMVLTQHEHDPSGPRGAYGVQAVEIVHAQPVVRAVIGGRELRATPQHRVHIGDRWVTLESLGASDGHGDIVKIGVTDARTYVANGILSHNLKPIT